MDTTEAVIIIHDHVADGAPIDDATLRACAPLFATDLHARDAVIMCALRPDDASLDHILGFALHPHDKSNAALQARILAAVMFGTLPVDTESLGRAMSLFERMRDLDDTPEHHNPFTATLMYFAWLTNDMPAVAAHTAELDEDQPVPRLARIVLCALSKGMHTEAKMD
ncbi:hypothetical protein [Bifidobacterium castoris]|uniref:Uncharacterized protein n=1 Tax=Bifidobacterium castoris TaxID=2306972 RepID=A0A430FAF3_9BIFI|nr:hypothetical protein [Bifidobacterium castoris]RSX49805.1 hypothetical protein D2E22_0266 [Bifidobacterium castoris]